MEPRRCYHVTVPLADKTANVYFEPAIVRSAMPSSADTALLTLILQSISHALARTLGPHDYYIHQLQRDMNQNDGGGFHMTVVSAGKPSKEVYFSRNDLFGLDQEYPKKEIPIESLPPALERIASSVKAERKLAAIQHSHNIGIEFLKERAKQKEQAQLEKKRVEEEKIAREKAEKRAAEQKIIATEKAKIKAEHDLRAVKKLVSFGEKDDLIKLAASQYDEAKFAAQVAVQNIEVKKLSREARDSKSYDPDILEKRIKEKQKEHLEKLANSAKMIEQKIAEHEDKIAEIQQKSDTTFLTAYDQYDKAMAGLYHRVLAESLSAFTAKHFTTHAHDLGEIALAAELEVPVVKKGEVISAGLAHGLYSKRVTDHLVGKSAEEMNIVFGNIKARLGANHALVLSLNSAIQKATSDQKGRARIEGFSLAVVAQDMQQAAKQIKDMQAEIVEDLAARAAAIEQYQLFLEREKADLVAVQNLRSTAQALSGQALIIKPKLGEVKETVGRLKAQLTGAIEKKETIYSSARTEFVAASLQQIDLAMHAIDNIAAKNVSTVKSVNNQLRNDYITGETAESVVKKSQKILDSSINDAEVQYQAARCAAQAIKACHLEVTLLAERDKTAAILREAKQLTEEIAASEALHRLPKKTAVSEEIVDITSALTKIESINSNNFSHVAKISAELKQENLGNSEAKDKVDQSQLILAGSIEQAKAQVQEAQEALESIKLKHAEVQLLAAQKELYDTIKSTLVDQIPYWNDQRLSGGTKVVSEGKQIKVPTGIGEMINIINGAPPEKPRRSFFASVSPVSVATAEPTADEIAHRLKDFQKISSTRLATKGFFVSSRRDVTTDFYTKLRSTPSTLLENPDKQKAKATSDTLLKQAAEFKKFAEEMRDTQAAKKLTAPTAAAKKKK